MAANNFVFLLSRGGSMIFSSVNFQKHFETFVNLISKSSKLVFRVLPNYCKDLILTKLLRRRQLYEKKSLKKRF